ncbi:NADH:ubiquinone oxidoreductase complex I, chain G [Cupriavidus taiwanensis]|uniref:NADH-quinone oxidoreductase n=1 Tax=Cupriavidus taiwanensis TaxID=164546 RepID=A0A375IFT6_9BURK|nr:NADH-quinone oxidoreductase subunit NuoG [Cupriavidus taiwanensis]SOY56400.1 NADH:ubiquinone oxidoreductase complex I, chain G [Cupriavidus taiwanensis]SOY57075.1 NADH:ubiquinone oxidoreductase complex I, chain G [Cupriavidus taiwanensis]SOY79160.1 NADH:ubiquinone oxidoreductase complex I, chain G [Cupriavidus taiwanensis]SOZ64564.1 NADH:ubiquinone oxidoreductase complex I, chain G [Cupriavidus taiwanensis]SOZ83282.1 NADH:ubiquinone oxidoreductase complex I, chain G [Cupriavidus taiwanensis
MVELEIDGKKVEVAEGSLVMEAARKLGTYIPHFCYHRKLSIAANCRMCLVEVEKAPKALPACATPVTPGMKVFTNSEKAVKAQKSVMEFLLINHPLDCPICDQGGECQLQDLAVGYGASESRYKEEKRVVFHKNVGPLISMEEMTRCIHCTRCVRFGQEVAGVMELGMLNRGEHSEITTFVGKTVDSELSGNMIDLCPVGALTSKPFRYSARTWELARRKSVSPHDGLGANLVVQTKNQRVMRVLPLENEDINECWISDKDRFSYEGLNSADRLTRPLLKQGGEWMETDWQTALEYVANGLAGIKREHGADQIAALASPHSTLEELFLLGKLMRGLGSDNVDFRLRQTDFSAALKGAPWLGMPVADVTNLQRALVIGSSLRKDHPLLASRLRQATKKGARVTVLGAGGEDLLMPATRIDVAPSGWTAALAGVARAVAAAKGVAAPAGTEGFDGGDAAAKAAEALLSGERRAVFLGNEAVRHPQFAGLHALAQWIATETGATLGFLTEAANTVGGHIAGALPKQGGANAQAMLATPRKAYILLNTEPEFDAADPRQALAALAQAGTVVVLSPFRSEAAMQYADVILPVTPFTETAGTFVNCEGKPQSFNGVVRALGESRPGWKVLRVLGNLLDVAGFDYDTAEAVRAEVLSAPVEAQLDNATDAAIRVSAAVANGIERIADVPIYHADPIVRRAESLQLSAAARRAMQIALPADLFASLGIQSGDPVRVTQGQGSVVLPAVLEATLPANTVRVPAATPAAMSLGAMFGTVTVEKAIDLAPATGTVATA